jgi:hypothetical protein
MIATLPQVRIGITFLLSCGLLLGCASIVKRVQSRFYESVVTSGDPDTTGVVVLDAEVYFKPAAGPTSLRYALDEKLASTNSPTKATPRGGELTQVDGDSVKFHGKYTREGLIVFSNLPPGTYRLTKVRAWASYSRSEQERFYGCDEKTVYCPQLADLYLVIPRDTLADLTVTVKRGEIGYIGVLGALETHRPRFGNQRTGGRPGRKGGYVEVDTHDHTGPAGYTLTYSRSREAGVMRKLADRHPDDPWVGKLQARATELSGQ